MAFAGTGADYAGMAYVTATVTVWDADPRADAKLRLVEKVIQGRDFTAWPRPSTRSRPGSASLPAMFTPMSGSRRSPPQSRPHDPAVGGVGGPERMHFGAPRCSSLPRPKAQPVPVFLHVGDVGHTLIVGPTGAGKSVLLALMALQFRRYAGRAGLRLRLRRFDPGRGAGHGRRLARSRRFAPMASVRFSRWPHPR